jgi:hypothetical protein
VQENSSDAAPKLSLFGAYMIADDGVRVTHIRSSEHENEPPKAVAHRLKLDRMNTTALMQRGQPVRT